MERETSSLLIKSNRVLGTRLVEAGLTSVEDMESANESFIKHARDKDIKRASLLRILVFDNQSLKEETLLDYQLENESVGALFLDNYAISDDLLEQHSLELMRASWTIPLDCRNNRWFLASAYYMSDVVRKFWEDRLEGRITWYVTNLNQIESVLDEYAARKAAEAGEEENVDKE